MSRKQHYWWEAYGHFDPGENNLPHMGQVIRCYRLLRQWKPEDLAHALGQAKRHVYDIESSSNMPELVSRRRILCDLLNIPPVLLGLAVITTGDSEEDEEMINNKGSIKVFDSQTMSMYEGILTL